MQLGRTRGRARGGRRAKLIGAQFINKNSSLRSVWEVTHFGAILILCHFAHERRLEIRRNLTKPPFIFLTLKSALSFNSSAVS